MTNPGNLEIVERLGALLPRLKRAGGLRGELAVEGVDDGVQLLMELLGERSRSGYTSQRYKDLDLSKWMKAARGKYGGDRSMQGTEDLEFYLQRMLDERFPDPMERLARNGGFFSDPGNMYNV